MNNDLPPARGRSLYLSKAQRPKEDQVIKNGGVIHWKERFRENGYTKVPTTCGVCGNRHIKLELDIVENIRTNSLTGCCSTCAQKVKRIYMKHNGRYIRSDGYVNRHIDSFSLEEQVVLRQMNMNCKHYIQEHRAVMALHLGRPLSPSDAVHHINGDKQDNRIENLILYSKSTHSREHAYMFNRIIELESQIKYLQGILNKHGIPYQI